MTTARKPATSYVGLSYQLYIEDYLLCIIQKVKQIIKVTFVICLCISLFDFVVHPLSVMRDTQQELPVFDQKSFEFNFDVPRRKAFLFGNAFFGVPKMGLGKLFFECIPTKRPFFHIW